MFPWGDLENWSGMGWVDCTISRVFRDLFVDLDAVEPDGFLQNRQLFQVKRRRRITCGDEVRGLCHIVFLLFRWDGGFSGMIPLNLGSSRNPGGPPLWIGTGRHFDAVSMIRLATP